ncbi:carbohydrate kinase family protein [Vibrio ulleungensis]|uniref:Carbohydrate kinase family protein n=1 Tax=Vibrio ulleungensis TaxID=2807619 RepID=A0ABS2HE54_9VIBR|nr:carbohydrate kinase family protein [Vibrio ulleungensis]MBM7035334.1 carbohydrate kinase family protein [Vibrio ulleungensis]
MKSIACVGMAVADLIVGPTESFHFTQDVTLLDTVTTKPGGDAANVALNLGAMGVPVSLHTKLGSDLFGDWLINTYAGEGVDTQYVNQTDGDSTGVAIALVDKHGERVFLYRGGAVDSLALNDLDQSAILHHDIVHCSGFFLLPSLEEKGLPKLFAKAREQGVKTSLDVGWDNSGRWLKTIGPMLPSLDYFLPTLNEAQQIAEKSTIEECAQYFVDAGVSQVVIKAGAKGAYAHDGQIGFWVHAQPIDGVVDTTGAGDGFVSGFLASIARGLPFKDAVHNANRAGAIVVQQYGSTGAIKNYQQIELQGNNYEAVV